MSELQGQNIQTIEFLTVAMHFCVIVEKSGEVENAILMKDLSRIMPLLYLKGLLIPEIQSEDYGVLPQVVTQEDYEILQTQVSRCLKEHDVMVFIPVNDDAEGNYTPLSELLTDIYQDMKNFVVNFPLASEEQVESLVAEIKQSFKEYWGLRLLYCQQSLHRILTESDVNQPIISGERNTEDWIISKRQKDWGEENDI